ncbi:MAG: hypothetical protein JSV13_06540 [Nitrospiraceae bacterium]|nr:MAG: hypothetical protein JSV13_06540 [Nitrospiraceae bacterium]
MAEKLDPKELVPFEELLMANTVTQEAIINLLHDKGLINKEEILEEIKRLKVTGLFLKKTSYTPQL